MDKKTEGPLAKYMKDITKKEEITLYVPKNVGDRFRQVTRKSTLNAAELFEEMLETYARGLGLD